VRTDYGRAVPCSLIRTFCNPALPCNPASFSLLFALGRSLPSPYHAMTFSYELGRPSLHFVKNHPAKFPWWTKWRCARRSIPATWPGPPSMSSPRSRQSPTNCADPRPATSTAIAAILGVGPFPCGPDRDRLFIKRLREMTDAAAGVHRGARWCGARVAARGAGAAGNPTTAAREHHGIISRRSVFMLIWTERATLLSTIIFPLVILIAT
jgi:hypothetical protein